MLGISQNVGVTEAAFLTQLHQFYCLSEFVGPWSARIFENVGAPEASFLRQLQRF